MDCVCRLGSLGNSGSATTGDGGPNCGCKLSRFLFLCPLYVFKQSFSSSCHPPLFLCLILSYYSGARVFERIPVHEFHISVAILNGTGPLCSAVTVGNYGGGVLRN